MDNNFVNLYIEQLNNHNSDINKQQILLVTQIKFHEKVNAELSEQNRQLNEKVAQLEEQIKLLQTVPTEKFNKTVTRTATKKVAEEEKDSF